MLMPRSRYEPGPTAQQDLSLERLNRYLYEELNSISDALLAYPAAVGILQGAPDPFTQGGARQPLINYGNKYEGLGFEGRVDDPTGTITVPATGLYRLTAYLMGTQGSTTQNEAGILRLDTNGSHIPLVMFPVATNKLSRQTYAVTLTTGFTGGDAVSLWVNATTEAMGTFTPEQASFEIELTEFA